MTETLFDSNVLNLTEVEGLLKSDKLVLRPLELGDYDKGFLKCLELLTVVGDVSRTQFEETFQKIKEARNHFVIVIEDTDQKLVVASGAIVLEHKFTHGCGRVGHIEDIVSHDQYRGKQLGRCIIEQLKLIAQSHGCYKVILDCNENNQGFYERLAFKRKEVQMAHYFE